jgi:hypothetical protein
MTGTSIPGTSSRMPAILIVTVAVLTAFTASAQQAAPRRPSISHSPENPSFSTPGASYSPFLPALTYPSGGTYAYSVAIADVNGDGKPDLLVADCGPGNTCGGGINGVVGVLLGNGDGTFKPAVTYDAGGFQTYSVVAADLNGDGKLDLVVANSYFSNTVGVLLGNGDGTFQPVVVYNSGGGSPWSVAVADVNGDGKPDIVVANSSSCYGCTGNGLVGVLFGNGDGTFQPAVTYNSGGFNYYNPVSLAVADLNGDGKPDIAVTNACGDSIGCTADSSVAVLFNRGNGTFLSPVAYSTAGQVATSVAIADLNADGSPDLVVTNSNCEPSRGCGRGTIAVFLGHGNGTFQLNGLFDSGGDGTHSVAVGDLNADGIPDLAVANYCAPSSNRDCGILGNTGTVGLLLGNGDGTFQPPLTYDSGGYWIADSIAVADLTGDGSPDIAVVNLFGYGAPEYGGSVGVLLHNPQE